MSTFKHPTIKSNDELVRTVDHQKVSDLIDQLVRSKQNGGFIAPEEYMYRTHHEMTMTLNNLAEALCLLDMGKFYAKQLDKITKASTLEEAKKLAADALLPSVTP